MAKNRRLMPESLHYIAMVRYIHNISSRITICARRHLTITPPSDPPTDFDTEMYLEILKEDPPLRRYVSRGDTPDDVDIPGPHQDADRAILRVARFTMKDHTPRFQPILGTAGMGKTHLYWVIKEKEDLFAAGNFLAVYVPSPPSPVRIPLHLHTCIVDVGGDELFEDAVDMLITKFGD